MKTALLTILCFASVICRDTPHSQIAEQVAVDYTHAIRVSNSDIFLLSNFLCWARRIQLQFVLFSSDPSVVLRLRQSSLTKTHVVRADYLLQQLESGSGVILATPRHVFFSSGAVNLSTSCDVFASRTSNMLALRGTATVLTSLRKSFDLFGPSRSLSSTYADFVFHTEALGSTVCQFPEETFASWEDIKQGMGPLHRGVYPAVIEIPQKLGEQESMQQLKDWNLLLRTDECVVDTSVECPFTYVQEDFTLTIRILTMARTQSLTRLLNSLDNALLDGRKVDLEFHVDYPANETFLEEYARTLQVVETFAWKHGDKSTLFRKSSQGLVNQWLQPHYAGPHNLLMVLEDDMELSPAFFEPLEKALSFYYFNCSNYNPALFGIALERLHEVLGWGKNFYLAERKPETVTQVLDNTIMFFTQKESSWGMVYFPKQWNSFVAWARTARGEVNPCIPGMISNLWFSWDREGVWTPWAHKYIFDNGLYCLYFNYGAIFPGQYPPALVINHRDKGMHFNNSAKTGLPVSDSLASTFPRDLDFPSPQNMDIFDFALKPAKNQRALADRWRLLSNAENICWDGKSITR